MGLFGKKDDEDAKRSALFGKKSKKESGTNGSNPYANMPTQSDAYTQAKSRAGVPGYAAPASKYPDEKAASRRGDDKPPNDRYQQQTNYGADRYQGGGSRYDTPAAAPPPPDDNRAALFGGAKERVEREQASQMGYGQQPPPYEEGGGGSGYGAYGDRQLTAEEEEEEDVQATKQQMRYIKQEDVSSTRNALRLAAQAEEQGMNTLARIGAQGERIHNTEKNLDLTANHTRSAEEKAAELKRLNRSMFAMNVSNPFTASSRRERRDNDILEKHALDRERREQSRREGFQSDQRMQKTFKDLSKEDPNSSGARKKASLAERAKYQFEADSEDDEMENEVGYTAISADR